MVEIDSSLKVFDKSLSKSNEKSVFLFAIQKVMLFHFFDLKISESHSHNVARMHLQTNQT
jgi:hypothetical protein